MDRVKRIKQLDSALDDRKLVWFGPRGSDALGLGVIQDHLGGSFALYDRHFKFDEFHDGRFFVALEDFTFKRRLSRAFDEDKNSKVGELKFRKRLEECLKSIHVAGYMPTVICYEPHPAVETVVLQDGLAQRLGIDIHQFRRMSTKPLVERELRRVGVPVIPWRPVSSFSEIIDMRESIGGLIVRRDGGSSGKGIVAFRETDDEKEIGEVVREMLGSHEAAVSFAPLYENAISLNASAVVFPSNGRNGESAKISTFPISAQLVGQPELTSLEFGYSGNDFAFACGLDNDILLQCDEILHQVGTYLASHGYVGAFGVDYLLTDHGQVLFTEVNARFQGSTRLLSRIAGRADQADVLLEHLAATLGLPFQKSLQAHQWSDAISPFSQMYVHNSSGTSMALDPEILDLDKIDANKPKIPVPNNVEYEMSPSDELVEIETGALVERAVVRGGVLSSDGRTLRDSARKLLEPIENRYGAIRHSHVEIAIPDLGNDFGLAN